MKTAQRQSAYAKRKRLQLKRLKAHCAALEKLVYSTLSYQQSYNGRPSCPFCDEFIDDESTHSDGPAIALLDSSPL